MTMKALIQGAGSVAYFGRSTDTIPMGLVNYELYLADLDQAFIGNGTGSGMSSWTRCDNPAYMPMMTLAMVALSGSYADLTGKPSTFTPSAHNHDASDINSGTLADVRIPSLSISKTTGLQAALDAKLTTPAGTTNQYVRGDASLATFPAIPAAQVNSDWTAVSGLAQILNKPTIPTLTVGTPNSRSLSLATAYQATNNTKPAFVMINLTSTANFSLSGGTTNSADILIGSTNAVASGTGTIIGKYSNSVTGTIAVGLNMNSVMANTYILPLPIGWYFACRQTSGTVSITSAFDQALG